MTLIAMILAMVNGMTSSGSVPNQSHTLHHAHIRARVDLFGPTHAHTLPTKGSCAGEHAKYLECGGSKCYDKLGKISYNNMFIPSVATKDG